MVCYDSIQQLIIFTNLYHAKLHAAGVSLPEVTIEYNNINVDADALLGSNSIPSLTNVAVGLFKVRVPLNLTGTAADTGRKGGSEVSETTQPAILP